MALTCTVTKKSVTQSQPGAFQVTLNLKCLDGAVEVLNEDFSTIYKSGTATDHIKAELINQMQLRIDGYKAAKTLSDSAGVTNAITFIQNALVG